MKQDLRSQRGAVLGMVIIAAIVFGATAFAALSMGVSRTGMTERRVDRARARYAAEAGLVYAMQQLWRNPAYCGGPVPSAPADLGVAAVTVTVSDCGPGNENRMHELSARVDY